MCGAIIKCRYTNTIITGFGYIIYGVYVVCVARCMWRHRMEDITLLLAASGALQHFVFALSAISFNLRQCALKRRGNDDQTDPKISSSE